MQRQLLVNQISLKQVKMLWLCGVFKTLLCLASQLALHCKISSTSSIWGVLVYLANGESDWKHV